MEQMVETIRNFYKLKINWNCEIEKFTFHGYMLEQFELIPRWTSFFN